MSSTKSRRRPPLMQSLLWLLPALLLVAVAAQSAHSLMLIPLLLANALAMGAMCHATGFDPEPSFTRTMLRRGAAYLVLFTAYTALLFVLVAWPVAALSHAPSLAAVLLLSVALAIALAVLWRTWPAFALVFLWDDAFPESDKGSWIFTAVARSAAFARHVSAEERFFTHFLPASICLLLPAFGALVLSGLSSMLPSELRIAALAIYGLVLLPLCCLLTANRTLSALLCERHQRTRRNRDADSPLPPDQPREPSRGPGNVPILSPQETAPGAREEALLHAVRADAVERALALLEAGADADTVPDAGDSDQRSVLTIAALNPRHDLLRALIGRSANINRRHHGITTLLAITRDGGQGRIEAVMTLLANGADVNLADAEGNTALHFSARSSDRAVAAALIDAEAPIDALNRRGQSPLAIACRAANWPMVELLLQRRARTHADAGEPSLLSAASIADDDDRGVKLLLKHKARTDACDSLGRTALMTAALEGHACITRALLNARAPVATADQHGTTALMEAARTGATVVVDALRDAGAPVDARDRHGRDALTLACLSPSTRAPVIESLLAGGADPKAPGGDGRSALDCAAGAGRWDLVAVLDPEMPLPSSVAANATPDPDVDTPTHLFDALRFGHWAIVGGFSQCVREWPATDLAQLYVQLGTAEHAQARRWLRDHGLSAQQHLVNGQRMFDVLLDGLPASLDAVNELLLAGASPAGTGLLARALESLRGHAASGLPLVMAMLRGGAEPFAAFSDGRTPMHLAAAPGWEPLLQALADAGIDAGARDIDGRTPLHLAMAHPGDVLAITRILIGAGADSEASAANGETPLGLSMANDHLDVSRWLQWNGWPLPGRRLRGDDLPAAAAAGDVDAVDKLLQLGFAVDTADSNGASALIHACGKGKVDLVARLLDAGADISRCAPSGITPLAAAAGARHVKVIALLVEHDAAIDQRLPGDNTALMLACALGHADVAAALADAGAEINAADAHGRSALHAAAQFCFSKSDSLSGRRVLDELLSRGAEPNRADDKGLTPLLLLLGADQRPGTACDATHLGALLPVLLDAGAHSEDADQRGVTPLHACAMHLLLAPARILLTRGADRAAQDKFERTAADVARVLGYVDLAMELDLRPGRVPSVSQTLRQPAQPTD